MTMHIPHPRPSEREPFLVDGCPRCREYVVDLGLHDAERFGAFWRHMVAVEFEDAGSYAGEFDKELGKSLYYVALGLQRAFGLDPRLLAIVAPVVWE